MKKLLLSLAVCLCAAISANAQDWAVGARIGSGLQVQGEYHKGSTYYEGRFGMGWFGGLAADVTALHMWNIANMDWTPSAGKWFFDAGVGANGGGGRTGYTTYYGVREKYGYVGVAGSAKLGIKFNKVPIRLALDWSPVFGVAFTSVKDYKIEGVTIPGYSAAGFYGGGLGNFGISAVYCF